MSKDIESLKQRFPSIAFEETACLFNGEHGLWISVSRNSMMITDPFSSECCRFEVDPVATYGIPVDVGTAMVEANAARAAAMESQTTTKCVKMEIDVSEQEQEGSFMNGTLQSVGNNLAMTIHTSLTVPGGIVIQGQKAVAAYVEKKLTVAAKQVPGLTFEVEVGPSSNTKPANELDPWLVFTVGDGSAWRIDIAADNGAHVLVTGENCMSPPENPETEKIVIGAYDSDRAHGVITVEGRKGLNDWYQQSVGYSPDADNGTPLPMAQLLALVAEVFYLGQLQN